jgi:hypothetical protein
VELGFFEVSEYELHDVLVYLVSFFDWIIFTVDQCTLDIVVYWLEFLKPKSTNISGFLNAVTKQNFLHVLALRKGEIRSNKATLNTL